MLDALAPKDVRGGRFVAHCLADLRARRRLPAPGRRVSVGEDHPVNTPILCFLQDLERTGEDILHAFVIGFDRVLVAIIMISVDLPVILKVTVLGPVAAFSFEAHK